MINIAALSDIHGHIDNYDNVYPDIELVIIPGDLCSSDNLEDQKQEMPKVMEKIYSMFPNNQEVIVVPGNHDYLLERTYNIDMPWIYRKILGYKTRLLVDEEYLYTSMLSGETLLMYGNPRTNLGMAFPGMYRRKDISLIPSGLDILITHEAPRDYNLPCVVAYKGKYGESEPGCQELMDQVRKVKPRYHFFGHIHHNCEYQSPDTKFYNVSQCNGGFPEGKIKILEIRPEPNI